MQSAYLNGYDDARLTSLHANPYEEFTMGWLEYRRGWKAYWESVRNPMFGWKGFEI
jgi:hypothetical protein